MKPFKFHSIENSQPATAALLSAVEKQIGFIPNVFAVIAESSAGLKAFIELNEQFSQSAFNATSREIIQTATSVENQSNYCVAGHSAFADMQSVSDDVIDAVRNNQTIADTKLEALNQFTRLLVRNRGQVTSTQLKKFLDAGYTNQHVFEVMLGISIKTLTNFANNVVETPLDDQFSTYAWLANTQRHTA